MDTGSASPPWKNTYVAIAFLGFLFLIGMYLGFAPDMPYYDQWELVPLLEKVEAGTLRPSDLWAQHNEHRLVFPRMLMLAMAGWSDWNIYWELAVNVILAVATCIVLCLMVRRTSGYVHEGDNQPVYMLVALAIFSVSQWQNWFLGWQLQMFMNVLAIVVAFGGLTWKRNTTVGVFLAVVAGVVATYSFANGILVWPIGFLLLLLQRSTRQDVFLRETAIWTMVGVMVAGSYLYGYETPSYHPPLSEALSQPLQCMLYIMAYLGQPLGNIDLLLSICMGGLGLLVWAITLFQLVASRVPSTTTLPWLAMALYAIATATITALGRVDEGLEQAMSSRYVTLANLLWIPVVVQLYWVAQVNEGSFIQRLLPVKVTVLATALIFASLVGAYRWTERYNAYSALRTEMISGTDAERLRMLYPPRPEVILERRDFLKQHGLSIFGSPSEE